MDWKCCKLVMTPRQIPETANMKIFLLPVAYAKKRTKYKPLVYDDICHHSSKLISVFFCFFLYSNYVSWVTSYPKPDYQTGQVVGLRRLLSNFRSYVSFLEIIRLATSSVEHYSYCEGHIMKIVHKKQNQIHRPLSYILQLYFNPSLMVLEFYLWHSFQ